MSEGSRRNSPTPATSNETADRKHQATSRAPHERGKLPSETLASKCEDIASSGRPLIWAATTKAGKPEGNNAANVRAFFEWAGLKVWHNKFTHRTLIDGIPGHREWDDQAIFVTRVAANDFDLKVSADFLNDAVLAYAGQFREHPVRDYLDQCAANWDGTKRIDKWLTRYAGATEDAAEYVSAVGVLFLVAAVRRVRREGCKFDTLLVLEGKQGAGKSSVCRALVPEPDWFGDMLPLGADPKLTIEQTAGKWIVEFAELTGISKREVEEVKTFLSRQADEARLAYGRHPKRVARQFVAIGTTNDDKYLIDDTGNRRFLPVKVGDRIDLEALTDDRNQLWGEASRREQTYGDNLFLPQQMWLHAEKAQEARRAIYPIEEELSAALEHIEVGFIAASSLREIAGLKPGQGELRHSKMIASTMRRLGWEQGKLNSSTRGWHRGDNWRDAVLHFDSDTRAVSTRRNRGSLDDYLAAGAGAPILSPSPLLDSIIYT